MKVGLRRMKMTRNEMLFRNALTDALREIDDCPSDSMQDIINEKLKEWKVALRCGNDFEFDERVMDEDGNDEE